MGPFEVLDRVGSVSYQLALPPHIRTPDIFNVSLLKIYIVDKAHIIDWNNLHIEPKGYFYMELVCILDMREVVLLKKTIMQVKVQLDHYAPKEATREREDVMRQVYPGLFQNFNQNESSLRMVTIF